MNPIAQAIQILYTAASRANKPIVSPMYSEGNLLGLQPGELRPRNTHEVVPGCEGLVFAVSCNADEAQELIDMVLAWQEKREAKVNGAN